MAKKKFLMQVLAALGIGALLVLAVFWNQRSSSNVLTLYGNVDVRQVDLGFRVNGRVAEMIFEEGDLVRPGQLMGFLDPIPYQEELNQAKARLAAVQASFENANRVLSRRQEVISSGAVSKENFDEAYWNAKRLEEDAKEAAANLERAETRLGDTKVYAPTLGTILTRVREPGAVVNFGEPIYTLSITDPVWVRAFISEPNLGTIFPGMKAEIHTDTPELPVYEGHIGFISPIAEFTPKSVETATLRTDLVYRIRVIVDNPDRKLKQGMPVTVKIPLNQES